jgi:hypothetical protein
LSKILSKETTETFTLDRYGCKCKSYYRVLLPSGRVEKFSTGNIYKVCNKEDIKDFERNQKLKVFYKRYPLILRWVKILDNGLDTFLKEVIGFEKIKQTLDIKGFVSDGQVLKIQELLHLVEA